MRTLSVKYYIEQAVYDLGGYVCGYTRWRAKCPFGHIEDKERVYFQDEFNDIQTLKNVMKYHDVDRYRVIKVVDYLLSYEDLNGESNDHGRD